MASKEKNRYIELLRFIFCIIIVLHHSGFVSENGNGLFPSGGIIADAFFMLTGYFARAHIVKMNSLPEKPMKYSVVYTIKKLIRVLPFSAFGVVIIYLLELIQSNGQTSFSDVMHRLYYMIVEILLLPMAGIINTDLTSFKNAPLWYLSAVMIALPLVMYVSMKCKDLFSHYLVWFLPLILQGYMVTVFGGALPWMSHIGIVSSGVIRGISSLIMGFGIYYATKLLEKRATKYSNSYRVILTILEIGLFIMVIANLLHGVSGYDEIGCIYLIYIMLILTLSGATYTSRINVKAFEYLGVISMPIYCIHWGIYRWVSAYFGYLNYTSGVILTLTLCVVASIVLIIIYNNAGKRINRN